MEKVINKALILSLCLLLNCNVFGADLPTKLDPVDNYALSIQMPATSAKLSTHEFNIPFSYYLNKQSLAGHDFAPEVRVTFSLLNANCYAFKVFNPVLDKSVSGSVATLKCDITQPGVYAGYATICFKGSAIKNMPLDLCRTIMGNITIK